ncbi:uncharacterized protein LOC134656535 [Cydia amplana]|uniref:uncharacterized protein LOC134656535 n=1 Tax=Cydia amplana TaxID=1869771 RepID=UPI002FE6A820
MATPKASVTPISLTVDLNDPRVLTQRRGTLKGKLTLFAKYVATLNKANLTNIQKVELQLRINNAASYYQDFDVVQTRIEELAESSDLLKHLEYREEFEGQYYQTVAAASELADVGNSPAVANGSAAAPASADSVGYKVKLPTISLPTFDGSYEHWLGFRDTYTSLIHDSKDLGAIQKFHYLRAALTGTALQVIKSLEFSAENYTTAWELLENRFNNHRLLTHNYVKSLFNTQSINKESATQIRKLIDSVLRSLRALKTLGEPTDSWDTLVIYLIVTKLDAATEREWEEHKGSVNSNRQDSTSRIKLTDLITFLQNRADMLESIAANHSKNTHSNSHDNKKSSNQSQFHNFWELEEVPKIGDGLTDDERACEQLFASTTQRDKDGRFLVRLPLKESADALGDTYDVARSRFLSLERKLERLPDYKKMYCDFMHTSRAQTWQKCTGKSLFNPTNETFN